jgi:hypothetical protein
MILASLVIPVSGTGPLVSLSFCRLLSFYCCKFWPVLQGCFCCVPSALEAQHLLFVLDQLHYLLQCLVVIWEKQLKISLEALARSRMQLFLDQAF